MKKKIFLIVIVKQYKPHVRMYRLFSSTDFVYIDKRTSYQDTQNYKNVGTVSDLLKEANFKHFSRKNVILILTIDFMKVDFTDFVHHLFVVECNKPKTSVSISHLIQ